MYTYNMLHYFYWLHSEKLIFFCLPYIFFFTHVTLRSKVVPSLQPCVPAPYSLIVSATQPSGSDSLVYFQVERREVKKLKVKKRPEKLLFCPLDCVCEHCLWNFMARAPITSVGMRNQHLNYINGYVNTEATIIRRRCVGCGGDRVPVGLLAINTPTHLHHRPSIIQWVYSNLFCTSNSPQQLFSEWQPNTLFGRVGG